MPDFWGVDETKPHFLVDQMLLIMLQGRHVESLVGYFNKNVFFLKLPAVLNRISETARNTEKQRTVLAVFSARQSPAARISTEDEISLAVKFGKNSKNSEKHQ